VRGRPRAALAAAAAGVLAAVAGCSSSGFNGIYSLPLPGGASLGSHPYQVTAQFANVANLVPQSAVRVNDVAVGRVTGISVPRGSWIADVTMVVNGSVHLPGNAIAQVTQSGLLGEQYIALSAPAGVPPQGTLRGGAVIRIGRTTSNVTVEQVLGALSLLLNDGGIGQLHTITTELNAALAGNEPQIRSLLVQLNALLVNLNAHRGDITTALDGLATLSATLRTRDQQISNVLTQLTPGLAVLARQRQQLVTMLDALNALSGVAVRTINASQASFVADLKALDPTLQQLANAGQNLPLALQVLLTYPFTNQVLKDVKGDYLNAYLNVTAQKGTTVFPPVGPVYPTPSPTSSPTSGPASGGSGT
jgi:phospholipid/cholesterol/gamma-HCH transport system substrate-binding protein